jgi:hypothetical protein
MLCRNEEKGSYCTTINGEILYWLTELYIISFPAHVQLLHPDVPQQRLDCFRNPEQQLTSEVSQSQVHSFLYIGICHCLDIRCTCQRVKDYCTVYLKLDVRQMKINYYEILHLMFWEEVIFTWTIYFYVAYPDLLTGVLMLLLCVVNYKELKELLRQNRSYFNVNVNLDVADFQNQHVYWSVKFSQRWVSAYRHM